MFPTDSEFTLLYFVYFSVFLYFLLALIFTKRSIHKINLIVFFIYFSLMFYVFLDKDNFKGGNSLAVLFLGGILILVHIFIYCVIKFIRSFQKK